MFCKCVRVFLFFTVIICIATAVSTASEAFTSDKSSLIGDVPKVDEAKNDKDCDCGPDSVSCVKEKGKTICTCKEKFYDDGKGKCQSCGCGDQSTGCKLQNGEKVCSCIAKYSHLNGKCEYCSCGMNVVDDKCNFREDGMTNCTCKEGYSQSKELTSMRGDCLPSCNETSPCLNGGYCDEDHTCLCREGTSSSHCQSVNKCAYAKEDKTCGEDENVKCVFDLDLDQAVCRCPKQEEMFDKYDRKCKVCDCGKNGKCFFFEGKKRCDCDEGYFPANGTCSKCSCGVNSWSCFITEKDGLTTCECMQGYSQLGAECKECNCGPNGDCSFKDGEKQCQCRSGYALSTGICLSKGVCLRCDCGNEASSCSFDAYGHEVCNCNQGFRLQNGICYDYDECERDVHDCHPVTTWCVNTVGSYECVCKEGFQKNVSKDIKKEGCDDIDECLESSTCPMNSTTVCVNTPGSYRCQCKEGLLEQMKSERDMFHSPRLAGCAPNEKVSWRTIGIVCLTVLVLLIVGLGVVMYIAKRRRR